MLVLTRSVGESVVIGDDIVVKVVEVRGDVVRLGVEAPASVRIYREELYRALVESNQAAAAGGPPEAMAALLSQAARRAGGAAPAPGPDAPAGVPAPPAAGEPQPS